MRRIGKRSWVVIGVAVVIGVTAAALVTRSSSANGSTSRQVVKTAKNASLGKRILVTRRGLTLYSLSAERRGRFICTTAFCLSLWKPLVVPAGVKPTGVGGLATVKRPDGKRQVAYRGAPLYRFVQDMKPGQVKGNGFRDVGVWRPVVAGAAAKPAVTPSPSHSSYSY